MSAESHAILGASSASRWMSCPGSVREIGSLPKSERNRTSTYADEGSSAHKLAEECLSKGTNPFARIGQKIAGELQDWEIMIEMAEAVQVYIDEVNYHVDRLRRAHLWVERSVQPLERDDMWGTSDVIILEPYGELVVIDFKYGRGVVVEPDWNDQMMYYGLGALREVGDADVSRVTLVVVQPRAVHAFGTVRRWEIEPKVLREFAGHLESAAEATKDPKAPLNAGDHCRFCPVAATCPALREVVLQTAESDFAELPAVVDEPKAHVKLPDPGDPEELGRAMQIVPLVDFWAREVEAMAQRRLEHGHAVTGYKLVRKRSIRAWVDAEDVERRLRNMKGLTVDDVFTKKLRSPAQVEKIKALGDPAKRKKWVAKHAHKPPGGLTVTMEADPREAAAAPLLADFAEGSLAGGPADGSAETT